MKEIKMIFNIKTGECKVETFGFTGSSCKDATKFLEDALGESSDFQKKADWYKQNIEIGNINTNHCG